MRIQSIAVATATGLALLSVQGVATRAAEIKIIAGAGMSGVLGELGPEFERATGHRLVIQYGVTGAVKRQIEGGESFDLAIVPAEVIDAPTNKGKFAAGPHTQIARAGMGVAVRGGAPKPNISSADEFKRAMLKTMSVAYASEGATGTHLAKVFAQLGIADEMKGKLKPQPTPMRCLETVAAGEVELAFVLTNIIRAGRGVELAGPFPSELQQYLVFTAGVGAAAREAEAATALVQFLASAAANAVLKAKGLEPVGR